MKPFNIKNCKAVFFDAGGTLFYPHPSVGEIYSDTARRYGCRVQPETLEAAFRKAWLKRDGLSDLASHSDEKIERRWWRSLVEEVFQNVEALSDFERFFDELYEVFGGPEVWKLYPGVLEVLAHFKKQGKRLGVISNWDSRLFHLCDGLQVTEYFDFILASAKFGAAKPSVKIFEEALRQSGVSPEEAVHIGDSIEDDIKGAGKAGINAILINRHPERTEAIGASPKKIHIIHDLNELMSL